MKVKPEDNDERCSTQPNKADLEHERREDADHGHGQREQPPQRPDTLERVGRVAHLRTTENTNRNQSLRLRSWWRCRRGSSRNGATHTAAHRAQTTRRHKQQAQEGKHSYPELHEARDDLARLIRHHRSLQTSAAERSATVQQEKRHATQAAATSTPREHNANRRRPIQATRGKRSKRERGSDLPRGGRERRRAREGHHGSAKVHRRILWV